MVPRLATSNVQSLEISENFSSCNLFGTFRENSKALKKFKKFCNTTETFAVTKDGMLRMIRAHDALTTAGVKCLGGTVKIEDFTCESEFFANEKSTHRFRRQNPDFIPVMKQSEVARKCSDVANKMRDQCFEQNKDGCLRAVLYVNVILSQFSTISITI
jgi:hypothetical protein